MEQKRITVADIIRKFREMDPPARRVGPASGTQGSGPGSEDWSRLRKEPRRATSQWEQMPLRQPLY